MFDNGIDGSATTGSSQRPSAVRYFVLFATFLSAVLLYLDRYCMSYAQRYVKEDLGLDDRDIGWAMSIFFLSYALAQVPSGRLTDRFGPRSMLTVYILVWSFFTAAMGWAAGLMMLVAVRLGAGLGQAGAYPTAAAVVGHWVPLPRRGLASAAIAFGGRVGGAIAPLLTAALVVAFVPEDLPSTLTGADMLAPAELTRELAGLPDETEEATEPEAEPDAEPEELTADQIARQALLAKLQQRFQSHRRAPQLTAQLDVKVTDSHPDTRDWSALPAILNDWITGPVIGSPEELKPLPIEREARQLLDELEKRELSDPKRERLNRLVLEAVFPDEVRKIYMHGWRPVMWLYGAAGTAVAGFFFWQVRNRPAEHARVNEAELEMIEAGRPAVSSAAPPREDRLPVRVILASRSLWCLNVAQFGTNVGWIFLVSWLPRYLFEVQHVPFQLRSWMASLVIFVGWIGMLFGGWLTDRLTERLGLRWGRALPVGVSRFVAMAAFLLVLLDPSPWMATGLFALVAFSTDLGSPAVWAFNQDVGGRYIASVLGWGNMWGNLGAFVSIPLQERIVALWGWDAAFLACAAGFLASGICGMLVDARRPIDAPT